jgi:hypothetical protein
MDNGKVCQAKRRGKIIWQGEAPSNAGVNALPDLSRPKLATPIREVPLWPLRGGPVGPYD